MLVNMQISTQEFVRQTARGTLLFTSHSSNPNLVNAYNNVHRTQEHSVTTSQDPAKPSAPTISSELRLIMIVF